MACGTSNTGSTKASNAVTTAKTASTNASNAVTTANSAASDAATALSTANTASTNATDAVNTANTASTNATNALNTANTAQDTADDAAILADRALALGANSFAVLYSNTAGTDGSKTIDLGDLDTTCANDHFASETSGGVDSFNCALGCGTRDLGSLT